MPSFADTRREVSLTYLGTPTPQIRSGRPEQLLGSLADGSGPGAHTRRHSDGGRGSGRREPRRFRCAALRLRATAADAADAARACTDRQPCGPGHVVPRRPLRRALGPQLAGPRRSHHHGHDALDPGAVRRYSDLQGRRIGTTTMPSAPSFSSMPKCSLCTPLSHYVQRR